MGASEEGAPFRAVELGRRNLLTLRFNDPDLERRFRARHAEGAVLGLKILCASRAYDLVRYKGFQGLRCCAVPGR